MVFVSKLSLYEFICHMLLLIMQLSARLKSLLYFYCLPMRILI